MRNACPGIVRLKRLSSGAMALALLALPVMALAQEKKQVRATVPETMRSFWAAQSEIARWVMGISSFAALTWLIGGCVLGYLIFSIRKQDALASARWGYCFGAMLWTLTALGFMWIVMQMRQPLWYIVIVVSVAAFFGLVFGLFFRTQRTAR